MGKTKIIRKFLRNHQPIFERGTGVTSMPVVAMQMPAEPVERDVYGELLNAMSAPGPSGDVTLPTEDHLPDLDAKDGYPDADHR